MDLLTLIAVLLIVVGAVLIVAGHVAPGVPPGAVNAGWGLAVLGVILLVVALIVGSGGVDVNSDRGLMLPAALYLAFRRWRSRLS